MFNNIIKGILYNLQSTTKHRRKMRSIGLNWFKVKYLKTAGNNGKKHYNLFGKNIIYVNSYDFLHSLKELFIEEVYKIQLPKNAYIIDCGANIGLSVVYFKKMYPDASVIAFEPDKNNIELLKYNVDVFGFNDVEIREEAVWNAETNLFFRSVNSLGSMITSDGTSDSYEVKAIRLKNILNRHVNMLKMDIEGAEYAVLMDIRDELNNIDNMFIEYHGMFSDQQKFLQILEVLDGAGFKYYIKEAMEIYKTPFFREKNVHTYEVQLNIFCFRANS